ncbi:MAG: ATP synthase F1 subunit delta [Negativicoccus succinicivorans]|nr:ATP synthase F1 subunit delta [Negativicoccus succinicivorans]
MKNNRELAKKYAAALLALAKETGTLEEVEQELAQIGEIVQQNPELTDFLRNQLISREAKKEVVERIFMQHLNPMVMRFLGVVIDRGRIALLPDIIDVYLELSHVERNIAEAIPIWKEELCTQCNHCVAACPHSAIRAKVVSPEALDGAPESLHSLDVKSRDMRGQKYVLQVAPEDCTGCNLCVEVCPAKDRQDPSIKAINMMSRLEHVEEEKVNYDFFLDLPDIDRNKL